MKHLPLLLLLAACQADGDAADDTDTDTDGACGTEPPSIDGINVMGAIVDGEPRLTVTMVFSDPDEALHRMATHVWVDTEADGTVDRDRPADTVAESDYLAPDSTVRGVRCGTGGGFPYVLSWALDEAFHDVPLDVAVAIEDADGWMSEAVLRTACVRSAEDAEGCPEDTGA